MKSKIFLGLFLMVTTAWATTPRQIAATDVYNGTGHLYIPAATPFGNRACYFDNTSTIASSVTTAAELAFLSGVTSNVQTQINALSSGAVLSVFGRSGAVAAQAGDYSAFYLQPSNNLSEVNAAAARTNLGLGSVCTHPASDFVASGSALIATNNLSDIVSPSVARTNLGLGSASTQPIASFDASGSAAAVQASSLQKSANLSDLGNPSAARASLGLGSAAVQSTTFFDLAGTAATAQAAAQAASDPLGTAATAQAASLQKSANLFDLTSPPTARANLGLGSAAVQPTTAFQAPLTFGSSVVNTAGTVTLVSDASNPGASQFYGTNAFGLKGWYPVTTLLPTSSTSIAVSNKATDYTVLSTDSGAFNFNTTGGSRVVTLPTAASFLVAGRSELIIFTKADTSANILTINPVGGDLIAGLASAVLTGSWKSITIYSTGSGWAVK